MLKNPSYLTHYKCWSHHPTNLIMAFLASSSGEARDQGWKEMTSNYSLPPGVWCHWNRRKHQGKHGQLGHVFVKSCQFSLEEPIDFGWWDEIPNYKIDRHIAKKGVGSAVFVDRCALEEETSIFSKCSNQFNTYGPSRKLFSNQLEQTNPSTCKKI